MNALDKFVIQQTLSANVTYAIYRKTDCAYINCTFSHHPSESCLAVIEQAKRIHGVFQISNSFKLWMASSMDVSGLAEAIARSLSDCGLRVTLAEDTIHSGIQIRGSYSSNQKFEE